MAQRASFEAKAFWVGNLFLQTTTTATVAIKKRIISPSTIDSLVSGSCWLCLWRGHGGEDDEKLIANKGKINFLSRFGGKLKISFVRSFVARFCLTEKVFCSNLFE